MTKTKNCWCGGETAQRVAFAPLGETGGDLICVESKLHDPVADGRPKQIRKLYIAGPMSGYPEANYPAFNLAEVRLRRAGFDVVNPANVHIDEPHHYVDLIRADLRVMLDCQGVAVLDNWWESGGARNEVQVAGILKMPVRTLDEWVFRADIELGAVQMVNHRNNEN